MLPVCASTCFRTGKHGGSDSATSNAVSNILLATLCFLRLICDASHRWPKKQFVEVSESYLEACGATVYFIKTPQTHVPTKFATHASAFHYQESILDVAEADAIEDI